MAFSSNYQECQELTWEPIRPCLPRVCKEDAFLSGWWLRDCTAKYAGIRYSKLSSGLRGWVTDLRRHKVQTDATFFRNFHHRGEGGCQKVVGCLIDMEVQNSCELVNLNLGLIHWTPKPILLFADDFPSIITGPPKNFFNGCIHTFKS